MKKYYFKHELNEWRLPADLKPAQGDLGFLLHPLHAYNKLYSVQFTIYTSEEHNRKFKTVILDNEWPLEKLDRCFTKDRKGGIPNALFQCTRNNLYSLTCLDLNGCGPLQAYEFDEVGNFEGLDSPASPLPTVVLSKFLRNCSS